MFLLLIRITFITKPWAVSCRHQPQMSYRYPLVSRLFVRALTDHLISIRLGWIHAVIVTHCHVPKWCSNVVFSVVCPPWRLKQHTCAPEDYHSGGGLFLLSATSQGKMNSIEHGLCPSLLPMLRDTYCCGFWFQSKVLMFCHVSPWSVNMEPLPP